MSQLQKAIHRGLREAGLDVQMEYNEGLFSVDLALFLPPSRPGGDRRKARASLPTTWKTRGLELSNPCWDNVPSCGQYV